MKVIGFVGSPRKKGNTDILVQQVLHGANAVGAETKIFYLNELNYKGCQGCNYCKTNINCRIEDDMTYLYKEIAGADVIVIGSPVYMWQISGQTKLFLDRWYAFINSDYSVKLKKGKKAVLVFSQGEPDRECFRKSFDDLASLLNIAGIETQDILVAPGFTEAGAVAADKSIMRKAQTIGKQLAE